MPTHTHKKFERNKKLTQPIVIQPRDTEIMKAVADYRFLDTNHIAALLGIGIWRARRRLKLLFHHGFLDRPKAQAFYFRPQKDLIYALGKKGFLHLRQVYPERHGQLEWQVKYLADENSPDTQAFYLRHTLMVANFRAALDLALKNRPGSKLVSWRQGQEIKEYVRVSGEKLSVAPDGFFTIEDRNELMHFFLEADRSTMTLERFFRKMAAYWQWKREDGHKKRLGIKNFRVLTLTISDERKNNLKLISRQADARKEGSPMFWFACDKHYDFGNPESVLGPIWQTPKDESRHCLLE